MFVNEIFLELIQRINLRCQHLKISITTEKCLLKRICLYSTCEHHLLPIVGLAHVAYISNGNVIGLSKLIDSEIFC